MKYKKRTTITNNRKLSAAVKLCVVRAADNKCNESELWDCDKQKTTRNVEKLKKKLKGIA